MKRTKNFCPTCSEQRNVADTKRNGKGFDVYEGVDAMPDRADEFRGVAANKAREIASVF